MVELTPDVAFAYTCTLVAAITPIILGSYLSVGEKKTVGDDQNKETPQRETMSQKDAYMFPVIGSAVLLGLYLLFKFLSKEYIDYLIAIYILIFGVGATSPVFSIPFSFFLPKGLIINVSKTVFKNEIKIKATISDLIGFVISVAVSTWYVFTKSWIANNILGFAFSIQGIALMSPGSYITGCALLIGLFFYDIFWVFGTDVMVTVAKNFDAPIKLMFPKNVFGPSTDPLKFSMLGLGDIVLPGLFIALLFRFDRKRRKENPALSLFYFKTNLICYFLGLACTIFVMHFFNHAQPALLYLVPACVLGSAIPALIKGEFHLLKDYSEREENPDSKKQD